MSARDCDITEWRQSEKGVLGAPTKGASPWPWQDGGTQKEQGSYSLKMGTGRVACRVPAFIQVCWTGHLLVPWP